MIVTIRAWLSGHTGYGHLAEFIGRGLESIGCEVRIDEYGVEGFGPLSDWTESHRTRNPAGICLHLAVPNVLHPRDLPCVIFTMWEASRLPDPDFSLPNLNYADAVVVPCRWNEQNFRAEGVTSPIHVVPLGLADCYQPAPMSTNGTTRFLYAARVSHGPPRKRVQEAIRAFEDAFPRGDENVRLTLKVGTLSLPYLGNVRDERISLLTAPLTDAEMVSLYHRSTVLFDPSSGEGFGFHPLQAMGCGRPVIACKHSGRAEFFSDECGWELDYDEVPATGVTYDGCGTWAMPRHASMVAALRAAHAERLECDFKGQVGAGIAAEYTWERSARLLLPVLEGVSITSNAVSVPDVPRGKSLSRLCRWADFETDAFRTTMASLRRQFEPHRKRWEEYAILSAVPSWRPGYTACGFGVGTEPLPAWLTDNRYNVLATDQPPSEEAALWEKGEQLCHGKESLRQPWLDNWYFENRLTFRHVDMRAIPPNLGTFDFLWSSSSLEHLGSIEEGLRFIVESSRHLKPGGVAAHTTEFNLTSNSKTHDHTTVCVFRRQDIECLPAMLATVGCTLDPVDWSLGDHELDKIVDPIPKGHPDGKHVHLKVQIGEYAVTSMLLVIRRPTNQ